MADQSVKTLHSILKQNDTKASSGGTVRSYSHDHGSGPILCMVHGYPESSFMFVPPFVPTAQWKLMLHEVATRASDC